MVAIPSIQSYGKTKKKNSSNNVLAGDGALHLIITTSDISMQCEYFESGSIKKCTNRIFTPKTTEQITK